MQKKLKCNDKESIQDTKILYWYTHNIATSSLTSHLGEIH